MFPVFPAGRLISRIIDCDPLTTGAAQPARFIARLAISGMRRACIHVRSRFFPFGNCDLVGLRLTAARPAGYNSPLLLALPVARHIVEQP